MSLDVEVPSLQKICATWNFDWEGVALAVFDEHTNAHVGIAAEPRRVNASDPVVPTMVQADSVTWKLGVAESAHLEKHVFPLRRRRNVACTIEAFVDKATGETTRIAIIQPGYSPLVMAGGMTNRSSLLIFTELQVRLDGLKHLRAQMVADDSIGYVPVEECVVGRGFARLRPPMSATSQHDSAITDPQVVWTSVQTFLGEVSSLTAECMDLYTHSEMKATNTVLDFANVCSQWRAHVGDSL